MQCARSAACAHTRFEALPTEANFQRADADSHLTVGAKLDGVDISTRRSECSYERIGPADLRLRGGRQGAFYRRRPEYQDRMLCVALCQGAGRHSVDVSRGAPRARTASRTSTSGRSYQPYPAGGSPRTGGFASSTSGPRSSDNGPTSWTGSSTSLPPRGPAHASPARDTGSDPVVAMEMHLSESQDAKRRGAGGQGGRAHRARAPPRHHRVAGVGVVEQ